MTLSSLTMVFVLGLADLVSATISTTATDNDQYIESNSYSRYIPYMSNTYSSWIITAQDSDKNVEINMDMDIENCCGCDYVKFYDGSNAGATLIGTYCGTRYDVSVKSTGRSMYVEFRSDGSIEKRGFTLTYYQDGEEDLLAIWITAGITLSVVILVIIVALITCVCYMCMKHKTRVAPIYVHYQPTERHPVVLSTMAPHPVTQALHIVEYPPPAYSAWPLPSIADENVHNFEPEKPPMYS